MKSEISMGYSNFSHAKISGISVVVPKREIRLEDELQYFDGSLKKVERTKKMIGLSSRRVADAGVTAADLCQQAAENLFAGMALDRNTVDALVFVSQSPDHAIPATACILQDKLHLPNTVAAFDVNQGCTAYTYGLWLASSFIDSGACKKVLVLVGEAGARHYDPDNRVITPIFGDCGSATVLEYSEATIPSYFSIGTDGSGAEALMVPAGHARFPFPSDAEKYKQYVTPVRDGNNNAWYLASTFMDGGEIFNFTMRVVPEHIKSLLAYAGHTQESIDWLVLHQANKQIATNLAFMAGFPKEKAPTETVAKYGNQSGASLPSVVCDQLCESVSEGKCTVLLSGYGVGLSWASTVIEFDHIWCSGIREFNTPEDLPTPEQLEQYWLNKFHPSFETEIKDDDD